MSDLTNASEPIEEASAEATPAPEAAPATEVTPAPVAEAPAATTEPVAEAAPAAEAASGSPTPAAAEPSMTEEEQAEDQRKKAEERARKEEERKRRDEAYELLQQLKDTNATFDVVLIERVKGGLRGEYNGMRVFLPASHFGIRKNVPEEELGTAIGQTVKVRVHELQSDDTGYKSAVVTRRDILLDEFWSTIAAGAVYDGTVTSVTTFGAFVNIGGVEGLVHVSRLSSSRVDNPASVVKKGDRLKVTVAEVDSEKRKLSLSHREHEESPWKGVNAAYPVGKRVKGTVRRITDFGAYVQVAPRIEGLLRISELSWTQRVKHPSDIIAIGQEIEVEVLSANEDKQQLGLGYKQTQANPWENVISILPVGTETQGIVQQSSTQGAVVRVAETFDGFMPRSKIVSIGRGQKVELNPGDTITVVVADVVPASQSLILAMKGAEQSNEGREDRRERDGGSFPRQARQPDSAGVTLGDLLNDSEKSNLYKG